MKARVTREIIAHKKYFHIIPMTHFDSELVAQLWEKGPYLEINCISKHKKDTIQEKKNH